MALRPLLLSAVVGIAALGAFHAPAAQAAGSVSISIGTGSPYHGGGYNRGYDPRYGSNHGYNQPYRNINRGGAHYGSHRPGYAFVPGHWANSPHGRVWVPAQYVRAPAYRYAPVQRSLHPRPLPGGFYHQRGGYDPRRGW